MKILHIVWGMENGGIENMLADIINVQIKTEEVILLVVNDMLDDAILSRIDSRCKFIFLKRKVGTRNPWPIFKLNAIVLFGGYNIVHLHQHFMDNLFVKANYVRTVHNTNQAVHDYRWHKGIIAISESVKHELDKIGYKNSVIINNGINFNLIKRASAKRQGKTFKLVQVSRILFRQKGQDVLLKALNLIINSGIKDIHLDYIGDGPDMGRLKRLIEEEGLCEYVSLLGNRSRKYIYENMQSYDLFIQPSRFEGFGLTVVEAMAAAIPILVSRNDGPLQIINNGEFGDSFENGNYEDAAEKIVRIMKNYPSKNDLCRAYVHAKSLYSVERTALEYLNFYKSILKK